MSKVDESLVNWVNKGTWIGFLGLEKEPAREREYRNYFRFKMVESFYRDLSSSDPDIRSGAYRSLKTFITEDAKWGKFLVFLYSGDNMCGGTSDPIALLEYMKELGEGREIQVRHLP